MKYKKNGSLGLKSKGGGNVIKFNIEENTTIYPNTVVSERKK